MALLAQFIGEKAVAQLSPEEVERICEFYHAEMLKNALGNEEFKASVGEDLQRITEQVKSADVFRIR